MSTVVLCNVIVYILPTTNMQEKYFFIAFPLKICYNKKVYPYDGGDFFMDYKRKL